VAAARLSRAYRFGEVAASPPRGSLRGERRSIAGATLEVWAP